MSEIKHKKRFKSFLIICCGLAVFCVLMLLGVSEYVVTHTRSRILSIEAAAELENIDCILVLGASVKPDGTPSNMLFDRILTGVYLYKAGAAPKIIMSGDHGKANYNEVGTMKRYAVAEGIASEDVFMDHAGFSTYESIYRAKDVFQAKKVLIVTQEYHLYRALYIAEKLGLEAYGVSADLRDYAGQYKRDLREVLARSKDFVMAIVKPQPTYLGSVIPISGNGDATNE